MTRNPMIVFLEAATAVLLCAALGLAKKTTTKTVQILNPVQISGTRLEAGTYQVALNTAAASPTLEFYQNRKEVAQTPVKLVATPSKNQETEVRYDTAENKNVITEIDFSGARQRILLPD
jgi:hypothetical protein